MSDELTQHDRQIVRAIDEQYAPQPLSRPERARLLDQLGPRLTRQRRWPWLRPAAAAFVCAGAFVWMLSGPGQSPTPGQSSDEADNAAWAEALLYPDELFAYEEDRLSDGGYLPEDYAAIESLLLLGESPENGPDVSMSRGALTSQT